MLILEDSDIALSNDIVIAQAIGKLLEGRVDGPDHIFIADTSVGDEDWFLTHPVKDGVFSLDRAHVEVKRPPSA